MYFERYLSKSFQPNRALAKIFHLIIKGVLFVGIVILNERLYAHLTSIWHHNIRESIAELKTRLDSLKDESKRQKNWFMTGCLCSKRFF